MVLICSVAGAAPDPGGPSRSTTEKLDLKRYVAAGDRAYVIGSEDGRFPPMGWHIRGEMGGVWAHPIKLLDGYWFALDDQWVGRASRFTSGAGYAKTEFPRTQGLDVSRIEFSPDGSPVTLVGLTVGNSESGGRAFKLTMDLRSELMSAYPWGWTTPSAKDANGKDEVSFDSKSRTLTFKESGKPWYATVGASVRPTRGFTGDQFWGPVPDGERAGYLESGNGTGGELT
jgi:hypothetical protein